MSVARKVARSVAERGSVPVTEPRFGGNGNTGPVGPADIKAFVGHNASPTSTGAQSNSGVGFSPKLFIANWAAASTAAGQSAFETWAMGMADASSGGSVAHNSRHFASTSDANRRHSGKALSSLAIFGGATSEEADLDSFDVDGFTLDWTSASGSAVIYPFGCLGGDDLEVSVTRHQMNSSGSSHSLAHGLGSTPSAILMFSAYDGTAPANTTDDQLFSIGAWAGGSQFGASTLALDNQSTTVAKRSLVTDGILAKMNSSGITNKMSVSSVDGTNVNVTYPTSTDTAAYYIWVVAIGGAKAQAGTFKCTSTDALEIECNGIVPKLFIPISIPLGVDSVGTVLDDACLAFGLHDGTNNKSSGYSDDSGVATSVTRRYVSTNSLIEYATTATKVFEATVGFDVTEGQETVSIDPTTFNSGFGQGAYLIIGA